MTYTWTIKACESTPDTGVIKTVHYDVTLTDGDYSLSAYGSLALPDPADPMIAYADVTEANVIAWVQMQVDKEQVETALAEQLEVKRNPPTVVAPLPWSEPDEVA